MEMKLTYHLCLWIDARTKVFCVKLVNPKLRNGIDTASLFFVGKGRGGQGGGGGQYPLFCHVMTSAPATIAICICMIANLQCQYRDRGITYLQFGGLVYNAYVHKIRETVQ